MRFRRLSEHRIFVCPTLVTCSLGSFLIVHLQLQFTCLQQNALSKIITLQCKAIFFSTGNDVNVINTAVKIKKLQKRSFDTSILVAIQRRVQTVQSFRAKPLGLSFTIVFVFFQMIRPYGFPISTYLVIIF